MAVGGGTVYAGITRWITQDDSLAARRLRSRVGGVLFVIGTIVDVLSIGGQIGFANLGQPFVVITSMIAVLGGVALAVTALPISAIGGYLILAGGVVATGVVQVVLDPGTAAGQASGLIYIWLTVCTALYATTAATIVQVLLVAVVQGAALAVAHTADWSPQWIMMVGTCVVVTTVVNRLAVALRRRADVDVLTGAATRRAAVSRLDQEMNAAAHRGTPLSVVMLDLDDFKELNDSRGHRAGDEALSGAVAAWRQQLRPGDVLARLGGDEFLAVLPRSDVAQARGVAARLVAAVRSMAAPVTCSAGVSQFRQGDTGDTFLRRTDSALYAAKSSGGDGAAVAAE